MGGDDFKDETLLGRYGEKMVLNVLPAARSVSSYLVYTLTLDAEGVSAPLTGSLVVDAANPKEDELESNRRLNAESWREMVADAGFGVYRPVLLSTFLGNLRNRHTEIVAMDTLIDAALGAVTSGVWPWIPGFWSRLAGDVSLFVPHTPCLSCIGAFAQMRCWAPQVCISIAYEDWREWRKRLFQVMALKQRSSP